MIMQDTMLEGDVQPRVDMVEGWAEGLGELVVESQLDGLGLVALGLTPSDRELLTLVGKHPFLTLQRLAIVLGWEVDKVRRRRNRMIEQGLMRLVGPNEVGADAHLGLVELTVEGLEIVAAQQGLSEYDRSTMGPKSLAHKFAAYYAYWNRQKASHLYYDFPTVLFVTTTNAAELRIDRAACLAAHGQVTFLPILLTTEWRINDPGNPHGLLGPIWRELVADFEKRRYWLPRPEDDLSEP